LLTPIIIRLEVGNEDKSEVEGLEEVFEPKDNLEGFESGVVRFAL